MKSKKEEKLIKAELFSLVVGVEDTKKQQRVLTLLEEAESKIPDSRLKDHLQKILRRNMDYYDKAESLVDDLFDRKPKNDEFVIIEQLLIKLKDELKDEPKNWWDQIIQFFKNATGTK